MPKVTPLRILKVVALVAVIGLGLLLGHYVANDEVVGGFVRNLGYLGVFFIAYGSGFNLVVPIPAATFTPAFTAAGFGFWSVIVVMACGLTAADLTAFLIGRMGRGLGRPQPKGFIGRLEDYQEHHPRGRWILLFLFATFVPLPNEVLLLPMGYFGARIKHVIIPVFLGNLIFNALASKGIIALGGLF